MGVTDKEGIRGCQSWDPTCTPYHNHNKKLPPNFSSTSKLVAINVHVGMQYVGWIFCKLFHTILHCLVLFWLTCLYDVHVSTHKLLRFMVWILLSII